MKKIDIKIPINEIVVRPISLTILLYCSAEILVTTNDPMIIKNENITNEYNILSLTASIKVL